MRKDPRRKWYVIEHIARFRCGPGIRDQRIREHARLDALPVMWIEKEPGNAGKVQHHTLGRELDDLATQVKANPVSGPKATRWEAVAGPAEQRRVWVWNDPDWLLDFLDEAEEAHPDPKMSGPHDDMLDAVAGAIAVMKSTGSASVVAQHHTDTIPRARPAGHGARAAATSTRSRGGRRR